MKLKKSDRFALFFGLCYNAKEEMLMDDLFFKEPTIEDVENVLEYKKEFDKVKQQFVDWEGIGNFEKWLKHINGENLGEIDTGFEHVKLFLLYRKSDGKLVGVAEVRSVLSDFLFKYFGHIGYSIRPSEQRKGYGTKIVKLLLAECEKLGMDKVLIVCFKNNLASAKIIKNNNGELENEIIDENGKEFLQRYWVNLKKRGK